MAISATLPGDPLVVEPGGSATLALIVKNEGLEPEPVEVSLEGLDPDWVALPLPTLTLAPGETTRVLFVLRPPRTSESAAGEYPFLARVRPLRDESAGGDRVATGILRVGAYHHVTIEISPRKGFVKPTKRSNVFEATVANLGNSEHTLLLSGGDPEDACAYEFDRESVVLGPGMQETVEVAVNPRSRGMIASSRLIAFAVTVRAAEAPNAVASAQGQLEVRPLLTPAALVFGLITAALIGVVWALQPKPPRITDLTVQPSSIVRGEKVTIRWRSEGATAVQLRVGGVPISGSLLPPEGERTIELKDTGDLLIAAAPYREETQGTEREATVAVSAPVVAPDPKIVLLETSAREVPVGRSFILKYKFNDAVTAAKISPLARELDLSLDSIQIPTDTPGPMEFTVVAQNKDGKRVSKSFTVEVTDPSMAVINDLSVSPKEFESGGGTATIRWTVAGASVLKILYEGREQDLPTLSGELPISITKSGKVTLRAVDGRGKEVRRTVSVKVKPAVVVEPATNDPALFPPDSGGTGGGTGAGTGTGTNSPPPP